MSEQIPLDPQINPANHEAAQANVAAWNQVAREYPAWDPALHPHVERNLAEQGVPFGPEDTTVLEIEADAHRRVEAYAPRAETSPEHHAEHVSLVAAIDPSAAERKPEDIDTIGKMLAVGSEAIDAASLGVEPSIPEVPVTAVVGPLAKIEASEQPEPKPTLTNEQWNSELGAAVFRMRVNPFVGKREIVDGVETFTTDEIVKTYDILVDDWEGRGQSEPNMSLDEFTSAIRSDKLNDQDLRILLQAMTPYSFQIEASSVKTFSGCSKETAELFLDMPGMSDIPIKASEAFEPDAITIDYIRKVREQIADPEQRVANDFNVHTSEWTHSTYLWNTLSFAKKEQGALVDISYGDIKREIALSGDLNFLSGTMNSDLTEAECSFSPQELFDMQELYVTNPRLVEEWESTGFNEYRTLILTAKEQDRPKLIGEAIKVFGDDVTIDLVGYSKELSDGVINSELVERGITATGEAGMGQLGELVASTKARLIDTYTVDRGLVGLVESNFDRKIFGSVVRFEEADFGAHDTDSLKAILEYRLQADQDGLLAPMPAEYVPSEIVEISLLNQKDRDRWTADVVERYNIVANELVAVAQEIADPDGKGFARLFDQLKAEITTAATELDSTLERGIDNKGRELNDMARQGIASRRDRLTEFVTPTDPDKPNSYPLRSLKNFEQNFVMLAKNQELHGSIRKVVLAHALRKNKEWLTRLPVPGENPTVDDVSTLHTFVDHITNQETFKQYFTTKNAATVFNKITSVQSLSKGLEDLQSAGDSDKKLALRFEPTRGIMMELSGHIADACWANKYDSIAEAMPNMTAVIIKQRPGTKTERMAGAGMLLETTDPTNGEKILVVRGLNPLENVANKVSTEQFYDAFVSYSRGIAEARGMKLAITIDDHEGGAASNRPVLFKYLERKKAGLQRIAVDPSNTNFNDYDITNDVYEL